MKHEDYLLFTSSKQKTSTLFLSVKYSILTDKNHHVCVHNVTYKLSFDIQALKVQEFY